jgi:poly(A) polymerase
MKKSTPKLHPNFIDERALDIVNQLRRSDHTTYLVGGCVRDLLVGILPKDFDIATSARPNEVKKVVPRSYVIGKRFRLVLARRGMEQYEIATFRRSVSEQEAEESDIEGDNFFGTPEEDAKRRDFTINALMYDPSSGEVIDYCEGLEDIRKGVIRVIGHPDERLEEDPIRILRALRLAHKINFTLEPDLRLAMSTQAPTLLEAVLPRKREEYLKLLRLKKPSQAFLEAHDLGILNFCLPTLERLFEREDSKELFLRYLDLIPLIIGEDKNPRDLFAYLLLGFVRALTPDEIDLSFGKNELLEDETLRAFALEELGMFKAEYEDFCRAFSKEAELLETEKYQNRGTRRRNGFLSNESVDLAYSFAKADCILPFESDFYWHVTLLDYYKNGPAEKNEDGTPIKKRRRKRRPKTNNEKPTEKN